MPSRYPITDFNNLNLDWMISEIKDLDDRVETLEGTMVPGIIEDVVEDWMDTHPAEIAAILDINSLVDVGYFGNDGAAIVSALSYAHTNGKKGIYIPAGTYEVPEELALNSGDMVIGAGVDTILTIPAGYAYGRIFWLDEIENVTIASLRVEQMNRQFVSIGNYPRGVVAMEHCRNVDLINLSIDGRFNMAQAVENQPVWIEGSTDIRVLGCDIYHEGYTDSGVGNGVWIFSKRHESARILVEGCYLHGRGDELFGLFSDGYAYPIHDVVLRRCILEGPNVYGVRLTANGATLEESIYNVTITGNVFIGCGISIDALHVYHVRISDNQLTDNQTLGDGKNGNLIFFTVYSGAPNIDHDLEIRGNLLQVLNPGTSGTTCGFRTQAWLRGSRVLDNRVVAAAATAGTIGIACSAENAVIRGNRINGFERGIYVGLGLAEDNYVEGSTYGISTLNVGEVIRNNRFTGCDYGVNITTTPSKLSVVEGNIGEDLDQAMVYATANSGAVARTLVKDNLDCHIGGTARNMLKATGTFTAVYVDNYEAVGNNWTLKNN